MKFHRLSLVFVLLSIVFKPVFAEDTPFQKEAANRIILNVIKHEITSNHFTFGTVKEITNFGSRLVGSDGLKNATEWAQNKLKDLGLEHVRTESVKAPLWKRGDHEQASMVSSDLDKPIPLKVTALGNSVGTQNEGGDSLEGEVIEVKSLDEVRKLGSKVKDKIVFYNRPMDPNELDKLKAYDDASDQRRQGPTVAAEYSAKAVLVRSLTTLIDDNPHTGATVYKDKFVIPGAALSTKSADELSDFIRKSKSPVTVKLTLSCKQLGMTEAFNVIGEIKGSQKPDEYVVVGGHLDSWDISQSAQDDASGVAQAIEVVRAFKALGIRPKRTIRIVLFSAEEFGRYGGKQYAANAKAKGENHVGALEADTGAGAPFFVAVQSADENEKNDSTLRKVSEFEKYFSSFRKKPGAFIIKGDGAPDSSCLAEAGVCPAFDLGTDASHYFDVHHASIDTIEHIDEKYLNEGAVVMATWAFLMSDAWEN